MNVGEYYIMGNIKIKRQLFVSFVNKALSFVVTYSRAVVGTVRTLISKRGEPGHQISLNFVIHI
jgi:hypothetical protein